MLHGQGRHQLHRLDRFHTGPPPLSSHSLFVGPHMSSPAHIDFQQYLQALQEVPLKCGYVNCAGNPGQSGHPWKHIGPGGAALLHLDPEDIFMACRRSISGPVPAGRPASPGLGRRSAHCLGVPHHLVRQLCFPCVGPTELQHRCFLTAPLLPGPVLSLSFLVRYCHYTKARCCS